jgi:hypothetical protein
LSAIAATWRLWDEKKVEVCSCLYINHGLAEGVDLAWKGCEISRKRSPNKFNRVLILKNPKTAHYDLKLIFVGKQKTSILSKSSDSLLGSKNILRR